MIRFFFTKQFFIFLVVGGLAALLHWLSRIALSNWMPFAWAVTCAYFIGMIVAFTLNSYFVFPESDKPRHKQARDFIIINISFFPVVWIASIEINYLLRTFGLSAYTETIAHGIAVAIPMFATFLIYKLFAFKDTKYGKS